MFIKTLKVLALVAFLLSKNLFRLSLVASYGLFRVMGWLMVLLENCAFSACVAAGIFKLTAEEQPDFEKKFSEGEIESMAGEFASKKTTIKEIQEKLGVSYRQARKIQQAIEDALPVHHFRAGPLAA